MIEAYGEYGTWKNWSAESFGSCDAGIAAYFRAETTRAGMRDLKGKRIVEIGFGNGTFAMWCRQQGAVYSGTEVIEELVERGMAVGFDMHPASINVGSLAPHGTVDMVTSWDVFEHIEINQLKQLISDAGVLLRQGGLLVARFPSGDSPFARAIQNGDITHCTVLGSSAIVQIAAALGFGIVQLREPRFVYAGLPFPSLIRRGAVECARRILFPIIAALFMGGGTPVLTPNMVVVLHKK